ncbi:hypothetical protein D3C87_1516830 [compost metagenome]
MGLSRVANYIDTFVDHLTQQYALIKPRPTDQEIVRWPLAVLVLPPSFAQPFTVGFKTPGGKHAGTCFNALDRPWPSLDLWACDLSSHETSIIQLDVCDFGVVTHLNSQALGASEIGIHQCLAAPHKERISTGYMQSA